MHWTVEKHECTVPGDAEEAWDHLIKSIGLPSSFSLPHFLQSTCAFPDQISQGMRLEVVGAAAHTPIPVQLTLWWPQERLMTLSLLDPLELVPWRHYEFSVQSESQDSSRVHLKLSGGLPLWRRGLVMLLARAEGSEVNYAKSVLSVIVHERGAFPKR